MQMSGGVPMPPSSGVCRCGTCRKCRDRARWHGERRAKGNARRRERAQSAREKQAAKERTTRWRVENPEKRSAQKKVGHALKTGKLERQPCEVCGTTENVHAHHDDYSKPLEVRWLCVAHHRVEHGAAYLAERAA